jgi:hypothetical protein
MERCFWIDIKYATFGIISQDGIVIDAAPIAAWMISKSLTEVKPWLLSKGAKVVEVKNQGIA